MNPLHQDNTDMSLRQRSPNRTTSFKDILTIHEKKRAIQAKIFPKMKVKSIKTPSTLSTEKENQEPNFFLPFTSEFNSKEDLSMTYERADMRHLRRAEAVKNIEKMVLETKWTRQKVETSTQTKNPTDQTDDEIQREEIPSDDISHHLE